MELLLVLTVAVVGTCSLHAVQELELGCRVEVLVVLEEGRAQNRQCMWLRCLLGHG